jgi:DNA invertase Pin-like site-specific DNA recombinase
MIYGYARVSTDGQSTDGQVERLKAEGAEKIFRENISGAKQDRAQLNRLLARLEDGDLVLVVRLDRLARSTRDLLNILAAISAKGARFRSLTEAWADTTTPHGRLMVTILSGFAEFDRELILTRTHEGRRRAVAAGVELARKPTLSHYQQREALERVAAGDESHAEIARSYNVSRSTISRLAAGTAA